MPFTQQKPTYLDAVRGTQLQQFDIIHILDNPQKIPGFKPSYNDIISLIDELRV